jgi:hypothetical protein
MTQQATYRAQTPALALQMFAADAQRALAAGFQPTIQTWSQEGPEAALTVDYQPTPNGGMVITPITSVGQLPVTGKAHFKQKRWIALAVGTTFVLGLAAIGSASPQQPTPNAAAVLAATVSPTTTVARISQGTPTATQTQAVSEASPTPKPTAKATLKPTPRPTPRPTQKPRATTVPNNCHPSYRGACLRRGIGDYDCAGGSGNGPNYVGFVRVVGYDEFGLDRDHDGLGCE